MARAPTRQAGYGKDASNSSATKKSRRGWNAELSVAAWRIADNTINCKTKDVCKSKDASKARPPAAAIDTETNDSSNTSKHSRDASQSNRKQGR